MKRLLCGVLIVGVSGCAHERGQPSSYGYQQEERAPIVSVPSAVRREEHCTEWQWNEQSQRSEKHCWLKQLD